MIDIATDLDLNQKQSIRITRRTKDFSDITSKDSEFTRNFYGPVTAKNLSVIDNYGIIGVNSSYNPHKGIECIWTFGVSSRFQGRLEVRKVIYQNGKPQSIEFVFYGKQRTLANIFGADRFSDLDWSEYDHLLTRQNVVDSWGGDLLSGKLLYPLIDNQRDYFVGPSTMDIEGNISNENHPILLSDLKPAVRVSDFFKTIFSNYDLDLEIGNDLSDYLDGMYILPNRISGVEDPIIIDDNLTGVSQITTPSLTVSGSEVIISFGSVNQDPNGQISGGSTYNVLISGTHTVVGSFVFLEFDSPTPQDGQLFAIVFKVNGVDEQVYEIESNDFQSFISFIIPEFTILLQTGDEVTMYLRRLTTGNALSVDSGSLNILSPTNQIGGTIELIAQMPDDIVIEWVSKFIKAWNLRITADKVNPKKFRIESLKDYETSSQVRDWSKQVNIENITYSKRKVYKSINYKYKTSENSLQKTFSNNTGGRSYGELTVRPDVEFGEGELKIEHPCNIIPPSLLLKIDENGEATNETSPLTIHKSLDTDGSPVAEPWLLFYLNNNSNAGAQNGYFIQDEFDSNGNPTSFFTGFYPRISSAQGALVNNFSNSLTYALESSLTTAIPTGSAYKNHWQEPILNQYDISSRKIERVEVYLTTEEFVKYSLRDEIFLEGNYWRIVDISHQAGSKKSIVTLHSSRTNNTPAPFTVSIGGKINFIDSPTQIDLTGLGAIKQGGSFYVNSPILKIIPNLNSYLVARTIVSTQITQQINEIGGRFRSYEE